MDYALAIDIGGTNTEIAVVGRDGHIEGRDRIPTTAGGTDIQSYINKVAQCAAPLIEAAGGVIGAGVVAPCINDTTAVIEGATNLPWPQPVPLGALLGAAVGCPVYAVNDANAAAVGEHAYGAARGMDNFIMITLGTGVGGGVVCDGHLLAGRNGYAGELGHIQVLGGEGRQCGCHRQDCLETYCSASGVTETARKVLADGYPDSELHGADPLTARAVGEAADRGDAAAIEVWRRTGEVLGRACAGFAAFTDPEAFVFFGGVAASFAHFAPALRQAFDSHALHLYAGRVAMLHSGLPSSEAALLGAAGLVFEKEEV